MLSAIIAHSKDIIRWFDNYLSIFVWCRWSSNLTSLTQQGLIAEDLSNYSIPQWLITRLDFEKITSKSPTYLSTDVLLSWSAHIAWGFLSGQWTFPNYSNEWLKFHAAIDKPQWHHKCSVKNLDNFLCLAWSCKDLYLLCLPDPWNLRGTASLWSSKLPRRCLLWGLCSTEYNIMLLTPHTTKLLGGILVSLCPSVHSSVLHPMSAL